MKVLTLVGTRPEIIKLSSCIKKFDKCFEHVLCHTGQNFDYELNQVFFDDLSIRQPDYFLECSNAGAISFIASVLEKTQLIIDKVKPDAFVLYGDTNSCLSALVAKRNKVPVFHMEAGNRCFDQRVPEELNRKVVDHLSDVNLVLSEHARNYLISEGCRADRTFKTGSHLPEVLADCASKIASSQIIKSLNIQKNHFLLVSLHREENIDNPGRLKKILADIAAIANKLNHKVIITMHPRTQKKITELEIDIPPCFSVCKPFSFSDYITLQKNAFATISDSGTITEEAYLLNTNAINMRPIHERPEGIDTVLPAIPCDPDTGDLELIMKAFIYKTKDYSNRIIPDYSNLYVSEQVARIVAAYTPIINRYTWSKY